MQEVNQTGSQPGHGPSADQSQAIAVHDQPPACPGWCSAHPCPDEVHGPRAEITLSLAAPFEAIVGDGGEAMLPDFIEVGHMAHA